MHACLNVCLWWGWSHAFWTKTNRIYKRKFSDVSKETKLILYAQTLVASNIMKTHGKIFAHLIQNMDEKKKDRLEKRYM